MARRQASGGGQPQYVYFLFILIALAMIMTVTHLSFTASSPHRRGGARRETVLEEHEGALVDAMPHTAGRQVVKRAAGGLEEETGLLRGRAEADAKPTKPKARAAKRLSPEEAEAEGLRPRLKATPPYLSLAQRHGVSGTLYRDAADFATDGVMKHHEVSKGPDGPRASYIENFWTEAEADEVLKIAQGHLQRSRVVSAEAVSSVRTSQGMFIGGEDARGPTISAARRRVSLITGLEVGNVEATQVLRYDAGQFYRAHPDYFVPGPLADEHLKRGGQRVATVLAWLNDVDGGGNTTFPHSKNPDTGLPYTVPPKKGDAIVFWNCLETPSDGSPYCPPDPLSYHAGEPPREGAEKWVSVFWVRQHVFT
eukprot:TRINITY_DN11192_c0_g1_i1.p1 TRINITY_DN11192_c0_g1~~TRINITY_DN11192_c0_g1_i1.p1  ORF type:complete len:367 (+),score=110.52 TRINITY_DN11192_c0_g1_i1:57-1157(+)